MTTTEKRDLALVRANEKRAAITDLRRRISSERGALEDVLMNPPDVLANWPLVDVVRLAYARRHSNSLAQLGRLAARDRVNLLMPLGQASERTREWTAEHASWHWHPASAYARRFLSVKDGTAA